MAKRSKLPKLSLNVHRFFNTIDFPIRQFQSAGAFCSTQIFVDFPLGIFGGGFSKNALAYWSRQDLRSVVKDSPSEGF